MGALFAAEGKNLRIVHHSDNLERWFDLPRSRDEPPELQDFFRDDCSYFQRRQRPLFGDRHFLIRGAVTNRGIEGDVLVTTSGDGLSLYEFEARESELPHPDSRPQVRVTHSDQHLPVELDIDTALRDIHARTRYPKIMLYRFLEDGDGEVVAELSDQQLDSYQGLRFPASDIPRIARRLYVDNPFRLVFDARGAEVPVRALPGADTPLDLALSTLRSVSPVHIEYLRNMGVRSSASFPIMILGRLWGLVAMHAAHAMTLSMDTRLEVLEIVERDLARRIQDQRIRDDHRRFNANARLLDDCVTAIVRLTDSDLAPAATAKLRQLVPCDQFLLRQNDRLLTATLPLSSPDAERLAKLGSAQARKGQFVTASLSEYLEQDPAFRRTASGLLYCELQSRRRGARIELLWIRREQAETVIWAGRPRKELHRVDGGERVSPRRSFAAWQQNREGVSQAWGSGDLMLASKLVAGVLARERQDPGEPASS